MSMMRDIAPVHIPAFSRGERLRKAREDAGYSQTAFAEATSISRRQIIYYENNEKEPKRGDMLLWQMLTRVPIEWLETGDWQPNGPTGGGAPGEVSEKLRFDNSRRDVLTADFGTRRGRERIAA